MDLDGEVAKELSNNTRINEQFGRSSKNSQDTRRAKN